MTGENVILRPKAEESRDVLNWILRFALDDDGGAQDDGMLILKRVQNDGGMLILKRVQNDGGKRHSEAEGRRIQGRSELDPSLRSG